MTTADRNGIFRREAVAYRDQPGAEGTPLRLDDVWSRRLVWLLALAAVATIGFACSFRVHEYASGPALVRLSDARAVTVARAGAVELILVEPGQSVTRGAPLVRLHDAEEVAELARVNSEMESNLVRLLRDPANTSAREAMTGLAARRDKALALLRDRTVTSPIDGVVSDLRVRHQQHVAPGDSVVTVAPETSEITLTAVLPGRYRPLLRAGQTLRFSLDGNPYEYRDVVVQRVGTEVVGSDEVRRYLALSDSVSIQGPLVLVHGVLPRDFSSRGEALRYSQGLTGHVDVRVRTESIALALFPGLRAVLGAR